MSNAKHLSEFERPPVSIPYDDLADWQRRAIRSIAALRKLPHNWDGYGSEPPHETALAWAVSLVLAIREDLGQLEFAPGSGGVVQIEFSGTNGRELELHVQPNGTVEFLKVQDGEPSEQGEFSHRDLGSATNLISWLSGSHA